VRPAQFADHRLHLRGCLPRMLFRGMRAICQARDSPAAANAPGPSIRTAPLKPLTGALRLLVLPDLQDIADQRQCTYYGSVSAQTLGFAVQPEDRPVLDELVAYFGDGNRSAYLRATLKVMKSIMIADQLREAQAYGQQKTAEAGIDPADVSALVQRFLKGRSQDD
jgi:hypothetical protein